MLTERPQSRKDMPSAIKHCQPWKKKQDRHSPTNTAHAVLYRGTPASCPTSSSVQVRLSDPLLRQDILEFSPPKPFNTGSSVLWRPFSPFPKDTDAARVAATQLRHEPLGFDLNSHYQDVDLASETGAWTISLALGPDSPQHFTPNLHKKTIG